MSTNIWRKSLYINERTLNDKISRKMKSIDEEFDLRTRYWKGLFGDDEKLFYDSLKSISKLDSYQINYLNSDYHCPTAIKIEHEHYWKPFYDELVHGKYSNIRLPFDDMKSNEIPIYFYNFFDPFLRFALGKLYAKMESRNIDGLTNRVIANIIYDLTSVLFEMSYRTLILELNVSRVSEQLRGETSEDRYDYFENVLLKKKDFIYSLYTEYPVLIRLLITKIINWVNFITEILERLQNDRSIISQQFFNCASIGELTSLQISLGDAHNHGKTVSFLEFENGFKIVYKPRSLKTDIKFQDLLKWINKKLPHEKQLYTINTLDRDTYGWMEFIYYKKCRTEKEIKRFYNRLGYQLTILYVLNAVDFHHENLIAHMEYPVLIDLEALFHQSPKVQEFTNTAFERASSMLENSVQSTGILPFLLFNQEDSGVKGMDISGIGGADGQMTAHKVPHISHEYTDMMNIIKDHVELKVENNIPKLQDTEIDPIDYIDDLKQGFKEMYYIILNNKQELKRQIEKFKDVEVRSILRPTARYSSLLRLSYHPDCLRNGVDRDILLHRLWIGNDIQSYMGEVVEFEKRDMINGDIPYFVSLPSKNHLYDYQGNRINNFFKESALSKVYNKIENLSSHDCQNQLHIIHMAMLASKANYDADISNIDPLKHSSKSISSDKYLVEAEKIGDYLLSTAITGLNDGKEDLCWISTILEGIEEILWYISPTQQNLYDGNSGIALFLGYLSHLTEREDFKEASKKALVPVRKTLKMKDFQELDIGAFTGISGYLYVMSHLATLWEDSRLMSEVLSSLTDLKKMISKDNTFDYIGGTASALSVFLEIYKLTGETKALNLAKLCSEHIIENAINFGNGIGWKVSWDSYAFTGFSHGTAGIVASLAQLYSFTKDSQVKKIISQALLYERKHFVPQAENWSSPGREGFSVAWCHGAPGILLSRLMLKDVGYTDELIDQEIDVGLKTTLRKGFGNNHTLCHGDFGNVEILQYAAKVLGKDEWLTISHSIVQQVYNNIKKKGWKTGVSRGTEAVGLMFGLSGHGWGLLKQYAPSFVPSILRLEPPKVNKLPFVHLNS